MRLSQLLIGQLIDGKYRLVERLGQGGFGEVFLADHLIVDQVSRQVAIKLIEYEGTKAPRQIAELTASTQLDHPYLLRTFTPGHAKVTVAGHTVDLLYLVMELAESNLDRQISGGLLGAIDAREMLLHVASALAYLHSKKAVHRDVKPLNILRVGDRWKLADFGILRSLEGESTAMSEPLGSRYYMPPEAFDGEITPAWDAWSLGVTALEALTARLPYNDDDEDEYLRLLRTTDPDIPGGLPEPFDALIRGCLKRNRRERWTIKQILDALKRTPSTVIDPATVLVGSGCAFSSVARAAKAAKPGTRILVRPGVYSGTITFDKQLQLHALGAPGDVILEGLGGACIVIDAPDGLVQGFTIRSTPSEGRSGQGAIEFKRGRVVIDRCDISAQLPACVLVQSSAANPTIRRCRLRDGSEAGLVFQAEARGLVEDCEIVGHCRTGLWIADGADPVIRRTVVQRCGVRGVLISERGSGFLDRCTVRENSGPGVEIARDGRAIFRRCRVNGNSGPGIAAARGAEGAVLDCDLTNVGGPVCRFESARVLRAGNKE